ncbi:MAG: putative ABC exporter domain-containing protein, partial [Ruminiclostridium sp.]|nr:putative ABC exporter domain-containing protein [Ruminiclostridium sp.]
QMEQRIKAKREGKGNGINNKTRKVKGEFLSSGSKAIFEKHLLEYRKTSYFMFFDKSSIITIIAGIVFKYLMPDGVGNIFFILFFSAYMLFFFTIQGKWPLELEKPYIFLIPESNTSKLIYCTMAENIKNLLDGTLLFTVSYFLFDVNPIVIVLCIISYTLYGAIYIYSDVLSRRLFGKIHSKTMLIFIKMFVSAFVVLPGVILMGVISIGQGNMIISALAIVAWNLAATTILILLSKSILNNLEISQ